MTNLLALDGHVRIRIMSCALRAKTLVWILLDTIKHRLENIDFQHQLA
jgi:hypothetical protein